MRYYEISVGQAPSLGGTFTPQQTWTSHPWGVMQRKDPGALNVQFDLLFGTEDSPKGNQTITVDGIGLQDLFDSQKYASDLNAGKFAQIVVKGGMQKGLPLANPTQAGTLTQGIVLQSFGNWASTDMNLNFVFAPTAFRAFTFDSPGNFVFIWRPGQSLSDAITTTLQTAYQGFAPTVAIGQYATSTTITGQYHTLSQFAQFINDLTKSPGSEGVLIAPQPSGTLTFFDGTIGGKPIQVEFFDFVGQPRWVDVNRLQFTTVMRSDIAVGSTVVMPKGLQSIPGFATTLAASLPSQLKYKTSFQGAFLIRSVRHIGNFRDADGSSWVSIFEASPLTVATQ